MAGTTSVSQQSMELTFHNVDYLISVQSHENESLELDVEQKSNGDRWHGEFSARYIEDVTHQTGNYKKFQVFVKMLSTGLRQESDSVFVDLLTYQDLEMLRSRQTRKPSSNTSHKNSNKRYLILTYAVEFDRVHYPLPLSFVDIPPVDALQATIRRLRADLEEAKRGNASSSETRRLREENADLKLRLKRSQPTNGSDTKALEQELQSTLRERDQLRRDLEQAQRDCDREVAAIKRECDALVSELDKQTAELEHLREAVAQRSTTPHDAKETVLLRRKLRAAEDELREEKTAAREEQGALRHELVVSTEQLDRSKQTVLDLRAKCRELTSELDLLKKRQRMSHSGDSPSTDRMAVRRGVYQEARAGARPSRTPSPGTSRGPSPGRSATGSTGSRPFTRFDPTAYVRNKTSSIGARSRTPSPRVGPGSRPSSAERSGVNGRGSRSSSVEKERVGRREITPSGSRSNSVERARPGGSRTSSAERGRPISAERGRPSSMEERRRASAVPSYAKPTASATGQRSSSRERAASRERLGLSRPPLSPRPGTHDGASSRGSSAALRPGVRAPPPRKSASPSLGGNRRHAVTSSEEESSADERSRPLPHIGAGGRVSPSPADNEISDIDARLNALQSFLKAAKSKAKPTSKRGH
mmetsp:Transcript_28882/g.66754  ORF Transcript_28882/g.66754 Transcript_28882/m.66754 type:complete len:646 (+) Transcript_28882:76-2013(+)